MKRRVFIYVLLGLMLGCSEPENQSSPAPPAKENVYKSQTEAIDKAKAAEKELEEAAAKQRQTIEDQEG